MVLQVGVQLILTRWGAPVIDLVMTVTYCCKKNSTLRIDTTECTTRGVGVMNTPLLRASLSSDSPSITPGWSRPGVSNTSDALAFSGQVVPFLCLVFYFSFNQLPSNWNYLFPNTQFHRCLCHQLRNSPGKWHLRLIACLLQLSSQIVQNSECSAQELEMHIIVYCTRK